MGRCSSGQLDAAGQFLLFYNDPKKRRRKRRSVRRWRRRGCRRGGTTSWMFFFWFFFHFTAGPSFTLTTLFEMSSLNNALNILSIESEGKKSLFKCPRLLLFIVACLSTKKSISNNYPVDFHLNFCFIGPHSIQIYRHFLTWFQCNLQFVSIDWTMNNDSLILLAISYRTFPCNSLFIHRFNWINQ